MAEKWGTWIIRTVIGAVVVTIIGGIGKVLVNSDDNPDSAPTPGRVPASATTLPSPSTAILTTPPTTARPSVSLSRDDGPAGTVIRISGEDFAPGERVVLRFHTEQIGSTTADDAGAFSNVAVTIPGSFAKFAHRKFAVIATGQSSARSAQAPFTITG